MDRKDPPPFEAAAPPAYDGAPSAYPDEKVPHDQAPPAPTGPVASSSSNLTIHAGGQPLVMHVYRDRTSKLSQDDVIMAEDKATVLYYLEHPAKWKGNWDMHFRRSSKTGASICTITKGAYKDTKQFKMTEDGYEFPLKKIKFLSRTHEYITKDGIRWEWKADGAMKYDLTLRRYLPDGRLQEVAKWDQSWGINKDGKLFVNRLYMDHLDHIVATAVAMEEWQQEQNSSVAPVVVT